MSAKEFEKEIKTIEYVLGVLYRCLKLYKGIGDSRQYRDTRIDIAIVEEELQRLIAEKEAELSATKEP